MPGKGKARSLVWENPICGVITWMRGDGDFWCRGDMVWRWAGDISHLQNPLFEYIFYTMLRFEYDENKSRSNLA